MKLFNNKKDNLNLDILHLHNTTHCVVLRKQNIEMKTGVQSYNYLEDYLDAVRAKCINQNFQYLNRRFTNFCSRAKNGNCTGIK